MHFIIFQSALLQRLTIPHANDDKFSLKVLFKKIPQKPTSVKLFMSEKKSTWALEFTSVFFLRAEVLQVLDAPCPTYLDRMVNLPHYHAVNLCQSLLTQLILEAHLKVFGHQSLSTGDGDSCSVVWSRGLQLQPRRAIVLHILDKLV